MGTLRAIDPGGRELLTEVLDEPRWWQCIRKIAGFMSAKGFLEVQAKYGFVLERDLDGFEPEADRRVALSELEKLIAEGLARGTIEFKGTSDFVFQDAVGRLIVMLCNDGDIHFASKEAGLVLDLGNEIKTSGVTVYSEGRPI